MGLAGHSAVADRDGLPESTDYVDRGCPDGMYPSCLACPLPRCRFEVPGGVRAFQNRERDAEMRRLRRAGFEVWEIVERMGVSKRTVYRALGGRAAS